MASSMELSFVPPQNFYMVVGNLPTVEFTVQRLQIPSISTETTTLSNPLNSGKTLIPGEGMDYSQLSVDFLIDKHFKNYRAVLAWMKAIGSPDGYNQFDEWVKDNNSNPLATGLNSSMSEITVVATDAANVPLCHWQFVGCFPISLDGPAFDATLTDEDYIQTNVTFQIMNFTHSTYSSGSVDLNSGI